MERGQQRRRRLGHALALPDDAVHLPVGVRYGEERADEQHEPHRLVVARRHVLVHDKDVATRARLQLVERVALGADELSERRLVDEDLVAQHAGQRLRLGQSLAHARALGGPLRSLLRRALHRARRLGPLGRVALHLRQARDARRKHLQGRRASWSTRVGAEGARLRHAGWHARWHPRQHPLWHAWRHPRRHPWRHPLHPIKSLAALSDVAHFTLCECNCRREPDERH
mmetsp:Transcript_14213/g.30516  ORF Transcript_14213/g.30516 Transcript_14213/m.30516 type:complete len:228 (-) Transcript_14213:631-1314(-)